MLSSVRILSRDKFTELEETLSESEDERAIAHKKRKHESHNKASKSSRRKRPVSDLSEHEEDEISSSSESYKEERSSRRSKSHRHFKKGGIMEGEAGLNSELARGRKNDEIQLTRKEVGLDWMLNAPLPPIVAQRAHESPPRIYEVSEPKVNPKELNPYFKSGDSDFSLEREDEKQTKAGVSFLPPSGTGDGGTSWRLKALKRAQEQAAREGRKLDEVVEERWGSLAALTSSVATRRAAHANAHHHAIRERKSQVERSRSEGLGSGDGLAGDRYPDNDEAEKVGMIKEPIQKAKQAVSQLRAPRINDSLSWREKKSSQSRQMRPEDASILKAAVSMYNKYDNDGNFLNIATNELLVESRVPKDDRRPSFDGSTKQLEHAIPCLAAGKDSHKTEGSSSPSDASKHEKRVPSHHLSDTPSTQCKSELSRKQDESANCKPEAPNLSANQVAAKAMRLRLMGKTKEADELVKQFEDDISKECSRKAEIRNRKSKGSTLQKLEDKSSSAINETLLTAVAAKHKLEDQNICIDQKLAESIGRNRQYRGAGPMAVDEEYDNDLPLEASGSGRRKKIGTQETLRKHGRTITEYRHIATQHERCQYCFENPSRPKHLVVAIGNFSYLMLPIKFSLVQGHCYIVPMQHEGSTRNVDDNVWEEMRNFKKCLMKMFMQQSKDVLFIETVVGLVRQKRHCLVECIPIPSDKAKQAPLYFKKAIDEAEDEWSQHNAKKLIDTRGKGLRACIPKNFPYFHVEFGIQGGYCHVIDDESNFNRNLGHDVVKGILQEPDEELHVYTKQGSAETQRQAVIEFSKMWSPYDWTKMLS